MIDVHLDFPITRDRHCYERYMRYDAPMTRTIAERELRTDVHDAAEAHAHELRRGEGELDEAINLVAVLLGFMQAVEEVE